MKRQKRYVWISLVLTILMVISTTTGFASRKESEEQLKKTSENVKIVQISDEERIAEQKILDENFNKQMLIEDQKDRNVGKILEKYTKNKELSEKAASVEKASRIEAMDAIVKLLESNDQQITEKDKKMLVYYLTKYAPYSDNQNLIQKAKSIKPQRTENMALTATSIDYNAICNYALQYYSTYNTAYFPDLNALGGDCTNFASQALYAGGINMQGDWYITKKNSSYPRPTTITELNDSWGLADPSPWISATEFESYWTPLFPNETLSGSFVYDNKSTVYNKPYYKGDIIQILKQRYWWYEGYHTMIITSYGNSDFLMTYHTTNTKNRPLHDIAASYTSTSYQFKFYSVE